jgi:hypothetical protein
VEKKKMKSKTEIENLRCFRRISAGFFLGGMCLQVRDNLEDKDFSAGFPPDFRRIFLGECACV